MIPNAEPYYLSRRRRIMFGWTMILMGVESSSRSTRMAHAFLLRTTRRTHDSRTHLRRHRTDSSSSPSRFIRNDQRCGNRNILAQPVQRLEDSSLLLLRPLSSSKQIIPDDDLLSSKDESTVTKPPFATLFLKSTDTAATKRTITVEEALRRTVSIFQHHLVPEAEWSACNLLAVAVGLPWSNGFSTLLQLLEEQTNDVNRSTSSLLGGQSLDPCQVEELVRLCDRRMQMEPLQYILGQWDWYDMTLHIRPPMLCPRPETEELTQWVIQEVKQLQQQSPSSKVIRVLDVGCGTGAIGIAIAKEFAVDPTSLTSKYGQVQVVAIDILKEAVQLSQENAHLILGPANNDPTTTLQYRALESSAHDFLDANETFDVVVSNPPYIPRSDMEDLTDDVVKYESDLALCGGTDGMDVIRTICQRLAEWTTPNGICWMEVDTSHPEPLKQWLQESSTNTNNRVSFVESRQDMFGRDRFVKLQVHPDSS